MSTASSSNTLFSLFQATIIGTVTWFLWRYFRQIVVTSPLDNVPGPPSESFLYGNLRQVLHKSGWGFIQHLTDTYPGVVKLRGPFGHRMLYIFDPVALHHVVVKDQHIFEEPHWLTKFNMVRFGPGLLATLGDQHRKQRKMLNPVFSIAHMRNMIPIFHEVVRKLEKAIEDRVRSHDGPVEIDMLNWMGRTALELIGQTGLGYSFDPLVADHPDDFASAIKAMGPTMAKVNHLRRIMPYLPESGSIQTRRTIMGMVPHEGIRQMKAIIDTLHRRSSEIYAAKKRALEQGDQELAMQIGEGKDIMSILMKANMIASEGDRIPEEELIAQMSHSPITTTYREAHQDTVLPLSQPIRGVDGKMMHEITVPTGTPIVVGVLSANRNKAIWGADALEWKPERWLVGLPSTVTEAKIPGVYSNLMTFMGGGRACIGFKFSQLEMKIVLCVLLSKFTFALSDKKIVWNLSNIRYPTAGDNRKPSLPMKVEIYRGGAAA